MKPTARLRSLLALTGSALLTISYAQATNLYWDSNSTTAGAGATPTGTWGSSNFWNTDSTGANLGAFQIGTLNIDDLFFSAGTDAVNAYAIGLNSATQNARLVTFEDGTATLSTGTLSLGNGGGITVTTGTVTGATISSNLTISGAQTFNVAASRTLTLDTGIFTRNAGATLNVLSTGTVTATMTNLAVGSLVNGIIGPWASFGSGASTTYATIDGSNNIVGLGYTGGADGTSAAAAANLTTSATTNFTFGGGAGTLGGNSFNTLRYTGTGGTMAGAFTSNGIMNVSGNTLTFSGAVTSGTGEMVVNAANGGITLSSTLNNNGNLLTITGSGNSTVTGVISGAGGLFKSGTGTLTLSSNASTYAGQLTVGNGTLSIGSINNVSANGVLGNSALSVILGSSGNTGTLSYTGGNASSTKRFTFAAGGTGGIEVTTGATTLTLSGLLDGTGNLLKTGAGTLTLSNNPNQFTGNTVITNGKVALGGQYALWQSAYDTTGSTGAIGLNVTGQANPWLGGLAGSVNLATAITGYGSVASLNLNPQSGSSVSYGGVIANGAANMTLNKTGHGTQTLTGTNTYSGATTVWAGTLALSGASGTALNSPFTVRGGTLLLDNSTAWADRLNNATALSLGSLTLTSSNGAGIQTETVGTTTFAVGGKVTINNGTTGGDQTTFAMGAVTRSVGAAINFVGTNGTLGSGANSPNVTSTGAFPSIQNNILPWATVGGTQWAENNAGSIRAFSGSFTTLAAATNTTQAQQTGAATLAGALNTNSLNVISDGSSNILALGGNTISFGSTNVAGTLGAILKSGANPYTISGGTIRVGTGGAGTELIAHVDGGALTISANLNTAIVNIAKGGTGDLILSGTRAGTMTGNISIAGGQLEFQGASLTLNSALITGAGGLTVNLNAGQTLTMSNNSNSYAGQTIIKGGYLAFSNYNTIGLPGGLGQTPGTNTSLISSNLILNGGVFNSSYVFNKDLGAGPGQVQILAGTSGFVNTASSGGASGFTLDGGREIVWGSKYFNPTVFVHSLNNNNNYTLNLGNGFDLNGSTRTVLVGDATYNSTVGVSQLGGNIRNSSGTAGLTKTGIGTLLLSGTNTYNGATTISSGILRFSNQVSLYNNTPASWTAANIVVANNATLALNVGGTGQFTTGNVTTLLTNLGGANGTSTTGFAAGSSIGFDTTNASGSTFTVADNIANSSGAGGGAIGVVKLGSNTLVLSGASNSYSGATLIRGGTLSLTGSLTGGTAITTSDNNNGGGGTALQGVLNQSAASVISGAASITQGSTGTSTLSGNNSYSGNTTLNAGTLVIGHASALGDGTGTIRLNGGTIQSSSATARTFTNAVTIGGNFTVGGTGNMTFSNTGASALGATRQITTSSGITAEFAQAFSGATFGITKGATAGTLRLSGTSTYTGATTLESAAGSVLEVSVMANGGQPSSVGQSTNVAANLTLKNATALRYVGSANASTDRAFRIDTGTVGHGAIIESSGAGTLSFTNPAVANTYGTGGQARYITFGGTNTGNNTYGKILANNAGGVMTINKSGTGTWIFDQANTYTGTTSVNQGTLLISGNQSSATGVVTVGGASASGTPTLGGTGTLGGNVTIATAGGGAAGTLAPGSGGIGNLVLNNTTLTLESGTTASFEVDADTVANRDQVTGISSMTYGCTLKITATGTLGAGDSWDLFDFTSQSGTFANNASFGTDGSSDPDLPDLGAGLTWAFDYATGTLSVAASGGSPYDTWATAKGLTGLPGSSTDPAKDADPDKDGTNNLAEFAFNGDPLSGTDNGMVAGLVQDTDSPADTKEMTLIIAARKDAVFSSAGSPVVQTATKDGVTYTIQGTVDLATIPGSAVSTSSSGLTTAPAGSGLTVDLSGSDWRYYVFTLDASEGLPNKGFLRAKVSE